MSRFVSSSSLLALALVLLPHAVVEAQLAELLTVEDAPPASATGETPASRVASAVTPELALGRAWRPRGTPTHPSLDLALIVSVGADFALLSDGDDDTARDAEGLQAIGSLRVFLGHDVWAEGACSLALGYEAMVGYGAWNLSADQPVESWLTRHGVGGVLRADFLSVGITSGVAIAGTPGSEDVLVGWTLTTQIAVTAGPVWIGIPWGVDVWPGLPVFSQVFGINVGLTTL